MTVMTLTTDEQDLLQRAQRFAMNVVSSGIAGKAAMAGYDDAEHTELCRLLREAAGLDRPLAHYMSAAEMASTSPRLEAW